MMTEHDETRGPLLDGVFNKAEKTPESSGKLKYVNENEELFKEFGISYTSVTSNLYVFPSRSRRKSGFSGISLLFRNHVNSAPSAAPKTGTEKECVFFQNQREILPSTTQSSVNGSPSIKF